MCMVGVCIVLPSNVTCQFTSLGINSSNITTIIKGVLGKLIILKNNVCINNL